jgi:surface antigen
MRKTMVVALAALALGACASKPRETNVAGASSGVVENSQFAEPVNGEAPVGAVSGGLLGADIGQSLTAEDRAVARQAEYQALEYGRAGQPVAWRGSDAGTSGSVLVGPSYEVNRLDCREYTHTVHIGGRPRVARGTACRQPDSTWRIVS